VLAHFDRGPMAAKDGPNATSERDAIIAEVSAGHLTADQAVERFIQANLKRTSPCLSREARADLEGVLRQAVADDPTFRRLMGSAS
jgi:hypothetical protein